MRKTFFLLFISSVVFAQSTVTLRHTFVDSLRNQVTFTGDFLVDQTHHTPKSAKDDGDIHCASRNIQIGMNVVSEIMNAKYYKNAVQKLVSVEGTNETIRLTGVWRFWFEHPGDEMKQIDKVPKAINTNPDHVFEIHPIVFLNSINLLSSLQPINGYETKDAEETFDRFLKSPFQIQEKNGFIIMTAKKIGYNYVDFVIKINDKPNYTNDGAFVYCDIYSESPGSTLLVKNVRMVFTRDSEPEKKLRSMKIGGRMGVLGIPRVNLNYVYNTASRNKNKTVNTKLPFEMIVVGIN